MQMELSGANGGPLQVEAGVQVVIECSTPSGSGASRLTPFSDERPDSPWYGRNGLLTDAQGYIFDAEGKLVGVLRELPPMPATAYPRESESHPPEESSIRTARQIEELEIATVNAPNGHPSLSGRLSQMVR
jgi:hypothetical protein